MFTGKTTNNSFSTRLKVKEIADNSRFFLSKSQKIAHFFLKFFGDSEIMFIFAPEMPAHERVGTLK